MGYLKVTLFISVVAVVASFIPMSVPIRAHFLRALIHGSFHTHRALQKLGVKSFQNDLPLTQEAKAYLGVLRLLKSGASARDKNIDTLQEGFNTLSEYTFFSLPQDWVRETTTITCSDGFMMKAYWFKPKNCSLDELQKVMLVYHWGGYVAMSAQYIDPTMGVAFTLGIPVLSIEYRMAPKWSMDKTVDDAIDGYNYLLKSKGILPSRDLILAGTSAGGGLVMNTLHKLKELGLPMPAVAISLSPWLDLTLSGETIETNHNKDLILTKEDIQIAQQSISKDPEVLKNYSPVFHDPSGYPPMMVTSGAEEILLDDTRTFCKNAKEVGCDVNCVIYPYMHHGFQGNIGLFKEASDAVMETVAWVKSKMSFN